MRPLKAFIVGRIKVCLVITLVIFDVITYQYVLLENWSIKRRKIMIFFRFLGVL